MTDAAPMPTIPSSPWHPGETALQRRTGVEARMEEVGRRVIRDHLIDQHRDFYPLLSMVVLGSVDGAGRPWATIRTGEPGFLSSPDPYRLLARIPVDPADPAQLDPAAASPVGLLGIDLVTRRRNRLNGLAHWSPEGLEIAVRESFGNCPKYIQLRHLRAVETAPGEPRRSTALTDADHALIQAADTVYVASHADVGGERRVDVSHRGGTAGFVRADDDGWLVIPDLPGNRFFSTLGNIAMNGRAGLTFADFTSGDLLQMTGDAEVLGEGDGGFEGAERLWRFRPTTIVNRPGTLGLLQDEVEVSPFLRDAGWRTGS